MVLESVYSTSAGREGATTFQLDLRDVCWDLPLTNFDPLSPTITSGLYLIHQIPHPYMVDSWGDYCTGSSYTIEYVAGPKLAPGGDPLTVNIMQFYSDIGGFGWHSNSLVPLFAKGDAARLFKGYAQHMDIVRGRYIDNTDIYKIVKYCLK